MDRLCFENTLPWLALIANCHSLESPGKRESQLRESLDQVACGSAAGGCQLIQWGQSTLGSTIPWAGCSGLYKQSS